MNGLCGIESAHDGDKASHELSRPFRAFGFSPHIPRALPWAAINRTFGASIPNTPVNGIWMQIIDKFPASFIR